MKRLAILGSTGYIGCSTLDVVRANRSRFTVIALVGGRNVKRMVAQCQEFKPLYAAMVNKHSAFSLRTLLAEYGIKTEVSFGEQYISELASLNDVDQVMSAIVGVAGLLPTLSAIRAGKQVLLANKESVVSCGRLFMEEVQKNGAQLLPIDSEHNAIFQCLPEQAQQQLGYADLATYGVSGIILTASGGALREMPLAQLADATPYQACAHPNWSMGLKISVDSSTMMNKGLEYIEARWLFNASSKQVEVVLHPQSVIHSMVRYKDGNLLAQLGTPDMCAPIAYAMTYPERIKLNVKPLDLCSIGALTFTKPDNNRYPCLQLAIDACNKGQAATTTLNAANEVAVQAFLNGSIRFTDIATVNYQVVEKLNLLNPTSVEEILDIDTEARDEAKRSIATFKKIILLRELARTISFKNSDKTDLSSITQRLPRHVAIIMDGNGRWAKSQGKMRPFGHKAGLKSVRRAVSFAAKHGLKALTLYAFSSENWRRPADEVSALMKLFMHALDKEVKSLHKNKVCLHIIGDVSRFDSCLRDRIQNVEVLTKNNNGLQLNIAANYGGRWDIMQSMRYLAQQVQKGLLQPNDLDEKLINRYMSTRSPVDLVIRTGGERRISNFLLWQIAYAELYFTDVLWPDFDENIFKKALDEFAQRERRFGRASSVDKIT